MKSLSFITIHNIHKSILFSFRLLKTIYMTLTNLTLIETRRPNREKEKFLIIKEETLPGLVRRAMGTIVDMQSSIARQYTRALDS